MLATRFPARSPVASAVLAAIWLALLPVSPVHAEKEPLVGSNYGPAPDWARFRELGEAALRNILVDPDSAKISWPYGYVQRGYTPWLHRRIYGYSTCGLVNSRNRMGGYAGKSYFGVVIDRDQVLYVEVGDVDGADFLSKACAKASFPSAAAMTAPPTMAEQFGFSLTDTPQGAVVTSITPGGAAERAGLRANMIVTHLNGAALTGLSEDQINEVVEATSGPAALTLNTNAVIVVPHTGKDLVPSPAATTPTHNGQEQH